MTLPSRRQTRNQLLFITLTALVVLTVTHAILNKKIELTTSQAAAQTTSDAIPSDAAGVSAHTFVPQIDGATIGENVDDLAVDAVNWGDVNLKGEMVSPEGDVKTARSNMLRDFEAR